MFKFWKNWWTDFTNAEWVKSGETRWTVTKTWPNGWETYHPEALWVDLNSAADDPRREWRRLGIMSWTALQPPMWRPNEWGTNGNNNRF